MLINLRQVALQIQSDGLYGTVYDAIRRESGKARLEVDDIIPLLTEDSEHLAEYRKINRESELPNIHLKDLILQEQESLEVRELKGSINRNVRKLSALQRFEASSGESAYAVFIGSAALFVIFVIHTIFGLFTSVYRDAPWLIYGSYLLTIWVGYRYYLKCMRNHELKHAEYVSLYEDTSARVRNGLESGLFTREELFS